MPEYSNLTVCLMGMGVTFVGLICLIFLVMLMGKLAGGQKAAPAPAPVPAPAQPAANRQEIIAAVAAAIAEELGTEVSAIRIVSFKRI